MVIKYNILQIKGEFAILVTTAGKHLQKKGVDVKDIQMFLITIYSSPGSTDGSDLVITVLESATSLSEIFRALSKYRLWDYRNYYLLKLIIEKFANDDHELNTMLEKYQEDLKSHILVQKMKPFLDAFKTSAGENLSNELVLPPELFKNLTIKVGVDITKRSLLYVDELWNFLTHQFSLPRPALILHRIAKGCVSIMWLIPSTLVEHITRIIGKNPNIFASDSDLHILRVMLEGQCIYTVKAESPLLKVMHQACREYSKKPPHV